MTDLHISPDAGPAEPAEPAAPGQPAEPAERRLRADARRNRERILHAARTVFAEHGGDAQIDDVARAACVGVGTVYRNFPTKDALQGELVRLKFREIADRARRHVDAADPWEGLAGLITESAEEMAADATQRKMMWEASEAAWESAAAEREEVRDVVGRLIARGHAAGTLRTGFTVDDMPALMCGLSSAIDARGDVAGDRWRVLLEVILAGLRA